MWDNPEDGEPPIGHCVAGRSPLRRARWEWSGNEVTAERSRPSGTVTFLFTDIVGSTRLWDEHRSEMETALGRHDAIVRDAVDGHDGLVFSTGGDGVGAVFGRSLDAVGAAVEAQRALSAEPWPEGASLCVRMGLHTGEVQERDGDYFGPPVNRAARVMGAAHGGQIVLTDVTAGVLGAVAGIELVDLGAHRLRGTVEALRLFGVRAEGVPWIDRPLASVQEMRGNLPRPMTEWFGSVAELQRRASQLPNRRLVTLTGTGGVGKTRMALEVGWLVADEFPGGVWFLDLAAIADPAVVVSAIASTLSVGPQPGMSMVEAIVDWLRGRRLLLVVDNCEHVMAPVSELVAAVNASCETVTVMATSREPLGLPGERVVPIPSLAVTDASDLFRDRAEAADAGVEFGPADLAAISTICERLDGIPLAIELAAARARSATPADLLARLNDRFRLLRGSGRGGLERHQTLRATVAWSHHLLIETERLVFDRLSVFAGTFDRRSAEAVVSGGVADGLAPLDEPDVADALDSLVDKSMVVAERTERVTRYRLHETLRQYAEERLSDRGETEQLRNRHLGHYVSVAERAYAIWASARQVDADAIFDREWDNLRAAHHWAITTSDRASAERLVVSADPHAQVRMRTELGDWVRDTLELVGPEAAGADLYGRAAHWAHLAADFASVLALGERGIAAAPNPTHADTVLCRAFGLAAIPAGRIADVPVMAEGLRLALSAATDPFVRAWGWAALSGNASMFEPDAMHTYVEELDRDAARFEIPFVRMTAAFWGAWRSLFVDDPPGVDAAISRCESLLAEAWAVDDRQYVAGALMLRPIASLLRGALDPRVLREAIVYSKEQRVELVLLIGLDLAAMWLARNGQPAAAALVRGHLDSRGLLFTVPLMDGERQHSMEFVRALPDADALTARGAAMSRDEITRLVLDALPEGDSV